MRGSCAANPIEIIESLRTALRLPTFSLNHRPNLKYFPFWGKGSAEISPELNT